MPVNPGDGEAFARDVARLLDDYEDQLLRLLARLVARQATDPDLARRALDLQRLLDEARTAGRRLDRQLQVAVTALIHDAYTTGTALAVADLEHLGLDFRAGGLDALAVRDRLATQTRAQWWAAVEGVPPLLRAAYTDAVAAGSSQVLGGHLTRLQASQQVLDRLLADGIKGFTDRAGRRWSLDTYVEMSVRTTTGQAAVQGHLDQLAAVGVDLVIVSDAPRECPLCRPWEGKVLSQSGQVGAVIAPSVTGGPPVHVVVAGTVEQARAAGLQHPNCRHSLSAYLPGATKPRTVERDPGGYEAVQRQREIERRIRSWKRRQSLALDDAAAAQASRKVRAWQAALREHVDAHDLKRLRYREQVGAADAPLAH